MFRGQKLSISRPDDDRDHSILIENLPVNVDVDDLATFCMANVVTIIREPAFEEEDGNSMKAFVQGQHGCSTLHIALLPAGGNRGAAWIAISGRDRRAKICSRLNGLRPVFLGGCKVTARQAQAFGCRMNAPHLHAIQPQLDLMAWESVYTLTGVETPVGSHHLLRLIAPQTSRCHLRLRRFEKLYMGLSGRVKTAWLYGTIGFGPVEDKRLQSQSARKSTASSRLTIPDCALGFLATSALNIA
jgi:hypothetical protein